MSSDEQWAPCGVVLTIVAEELERTLKLKPDEAREKAAQVLRDRLSRQVGRAQAREWSYDNVAIEAAMPPALKAVANMPVSWGAATPESAPAADCGTGSMPAAFWKRLPIKVDEWALGDFAALGRRALGVQFAIGTMPHQDAIRAELAARPKLDQPRGRSGGKPPAGWWPAFAEELAVYIHDTGPPAGNDADGQSEVIAAVFGRLAAAGKPEPARSSVQQVVSDVLRRIRARSRS